MEGIRPWLKDPRVEERQEPKAPYAFPLSGLEHLLEKGRS